MAAKDWSVNPNDNTDINGIDINEMCPPGNINDAIRNVMAGTAEHLTDPEAHPNALPTVVNLPGALLSRVIGGVTSVNRGMLPSDLEYSLNRSVIGDDNGTLGTYTGDVDADSIEVTTRCVSPVGTDEPTLLGNVAAKADLPLTSVDAVAVFGRTPALDDYARVLADESQAGHTVEYYITAVDGDGNLTWGNSIVINTSDYQAQSTAADAGKVLVGGSVPGTFGASLGFPLSIPDGGTGLSASPSMLVNLAGTAADTVLKASPRPGVTGILTPGNGGTGVASLTALKTALAITAGAPLPKAASGVGQWVKVESSSRSANIPSGGTWAYIAFGSVSSAVWRPGVGSSDGMYSLKAGVVAGGTTITLGSQIANCGLLCWRIS